MTKGVEIVDKQGNSIFVLRENVLCVIGNRLQNQADIFLNGNLIIKVTGTVTAWATTLGLIQKAPHEE